MSAHKNHFNQQKYGTQFIQEILGVFREYRNTETILKKESIRQNCLKKLSRFQSFYFDLLKRWGNK